MSSFLFLLISKAANFIFLFNTIIINYSYPCFCIINIIDQNSKNYSTLSEYLSLKIYIKYVQLFEMFDLKLVIYQLIEKMLFE